MKVSVTVEQKIVNGEAQPKYYTVEVVRDKDESTDPWDDERVDTIYNLTAPEAQELAEKLQAEVTKALAI